MVIVDAHMNNKPVVVSLVYVVVDTGIVVIYICWNVYMKFIYIILLA